MAGFLSCLRKLRKKPPDILLFLFSERVCNYTKEDLKKQMRMEKFLTVSPLSGRPAETWTNETWQEYFELLKLKVKPSKDKKMNDEAGSNRINGTVSHDTYSGETQYFRYRNYINDILCTIRSRHHVVDYCYYIYQIADLLKYEPELKTRLNTTEESLPYFEVWLEQ